MSEQICFEDVFEGQEIPFLQKKIMMVNLLMYLASVWLLDRIHFDYLYATQKRRLPNVVGPGNLGVDYYGQLLTNWAGEKGRLCKLSVQLRNFLCPEDTLKVGGKVLSKSISEGKGYVELELSIINQSGINCIPGKALVELPLRSKL